MGGTLFRPPSVGDDEADEGKEPGRGDRGSGGPSPAGVTDVPIAGTGRAAPSRSLPANQRSILGRVPTGEGRPAAPTEDTPQRAPEPLPDP